MNLKLRGDDRSPLAVAVVLALGVFTVAIVVAALADPTVPPLDIEQRFYLNIAGAVVGWIWMTVGIVPQMFDDKDNDTGVAVIMFAVGIGLLFVFNGSFVRDLVASLTLRGIGLVLLAVTAMLTPAYLRRTRPRSLTED